MRATPLRQLDSVFGSEMPREGLGRLRPVLGLDTLLADKAADELFHRNANVTRFALEPGLVSWIDVADGGVHLGSLPAST